MLFAVLRLLGKIVESGAPALGTPAPEPREPAPRGSAQPSRLPARSSQFAFLPQSGPGLILSTYEETATQRRGVTHTGSFHRGTRTRTRLWTLLGRIPSRITHYI